MLILSLHEYSTWSHILCKSGQQQEGQVKRKASQWKGTSYLREEKRDHKLHQTRTSTTTKDFSNISLYLNYHQQSILKHIKAVILLWQYFFMIVFFMIFFKDFTCLSLSNSSPEWLSQPWRSFLWGNNNKNTDINTIFDLGEFYLAKNKYFLALFHIFYLN